jgi:tetratricopeptide (TPR) repeat protein
MLSRAGLLSLFLAVTSLGCLEPPGVGRAADPAKAPGPAPWGSATSNAELEKKRALLEDILNGKITAETLAARVEKEWPDLTPDQRKRSLASVTTLLEDLQHSGRAGQPVPAGPDRDMAVAQLYFSERRFIEAATMLSTILDQKPTYPGARNLLARCFFFLGNRDRSIVELEYILTNEEHQKDQGEMFDALFLMGAAVAETPGMSRDNMEKGLRAWQTYLKLAPKDSPMIEHVQKGLADIEAGLRGEGPLAQPLVPVQGGDDDGAGADSKGALGGGNRGTAPMQGGASSAPSAQNVRRRVDTLPANASPVERLVAEGWDALDVKDLATAEAKLKEALAAAPASAPALTGLGRVYVQSGRIDEALRSFGESIKVAPDYMPGWHYNGMAQLLAGSPREAVFSWEKIKEKDPAYFADNNLGQRVEVAKRMAQ